MENGTVNYQVRRLFSQSAIYGIGDIGGKILNILLIPIHTHYLKLNEYNVFSLFIVFYTFSLTFYLLGINSGFIRYFLGEEYEKKDVFSTSFLFISIFNIFLSLLVIIFSKKLSIIFFDNNAYSDIFYYGSAILLLESLSTLTLLVYRAQNNPVGFISAIIVKMCVILVSNLLFLMVFKMGLYGAILGNLAGSAALFLIISFEIKKLLHFTFSLELLKNIFKYGLPTVPAVISLTILIMFDQYLLKYFGFIEKVGIYAVGYKIGMALSIIITGFRFAWFPFIFQIYKEENAKKIFSVVFNYFNFFLIFFYIIICVYVPIFFKYIFSPTYYEAIKLIPIVALGYVLYGNYENFNIGIYLKDKTYLVAIITGISALFNIILNIFLIPKYDIIGAAWATVISYLFLTILIYFVSQKLYSIAYDFMKVLKVFLSGCIIMILSFIAKDVNVIFKLFIPFLYFVILYVLKFFEPDEIKTIRRLVKKNAD
jgi:O-antigen/teichoic acid export membrane protein